MFTVCGPPAPAPAPPSVYFYKLCAHLYYFDYLAGSGRAANKSSGFAVALHHSICAIWAIWGIWAIWDICVLKIMPLGGLAEELAQSDTDPRTNMPYIIHTSAWQAHYTLQ